MRRNTVTTFAELLGFASLDAAAVVEMLHLGIAAALGVLAVLLFAESALVEFMAAKRGDK